MQVVWEEDYVIVREEVYRDDDGCMPVKIPSVIRVDCLVFIFGFGRRRSKLLAFFFLQMMLYS